VVGGWGANIACGAGCADVGVERGWCAAVWAGEANVAGRMRAGWLGAGPRLRWWAVRRLAGRPASQFVRSSFTAILLSPIRR